MEQKEILTFAKVVSSIRSAHPLAKDAGTMLWDVVGAVDKVLEDMPEPMRLQYLHQLHLLMYGPHYTAELAEADLKRMNDVRYNMADAVQLLKGYTLPETATNSDIWVAVNFCWCMLAKDISEDKIAAATYHLFFSAEHEDGAVFSHLNVFLQR